MITLLVGIEWYWSIAISWTLVPDFEPLNTSPPKAHSTSQVLPSISRSKISNGKSICPLLGTPLLQHQMHETCTLTQRTVGYWNGLGECSRKNLYLSQNPLIHSIPLRQQIVSLRRLAKRAMPWQWKHAVYTQAALTRSQNTMEIYIYSVPISMVPSVEFDPANFNYFSI